MHPVLSQNREQILRLAAKHGAGNVRVFGSFARGEPRADSDIDFLVEPGARVTPFFPGGLLWDLEQLLCRRVDVLTPDALHWYIRDRVLREATPL
jgi:uncharacterized protein